MPYCKKCNEYFSINVTIDGKKRNLENRKYCLECSPFGSRNTKSLELIDTDKQTKVCSICNRQYTNKGILCGTCLATRYKQNRKLQAIEYKGGKCQLCGYHKCPKALDFHHIDETQKEFGISGNHACSWEKLKKELDKCILLCRNCHAEVHDGMTKLA